MGLLHVYAQVLAKLGRDSRLGWLLALANVAVAIALFAEPVLFGRVINVLAGAQANTESTDWTRLWLLLFAWAGFGLFTIVCGTLIALFADRLAHRCRLAVLTSYFEHVLQLPLAYHGETHSGRLMKIMLQGTDALWAFWLGFFRENLAAFVSLFLLVPLALFLNWRMAILLIVLCVLFAALTALVLRKTEALQSTVQTHHSDLAERASDALGNIALVHSFVRVESEVTALKSVSERLLARTVSGALMVGGCDSAYARFDNAGNSIHHRPWHLAVPEGPDHGRRDRDLYGARRHGRRTSRAGGQFRQPHDPRRGTLLREFFDVLDTIPRCTTGPAPLIPAA
jgi:ATP-binding cassette subfamily B protein